MIRPTGYLARETVLHRLDPRIKILAVFVLSAGVFAANAAGAVLITAALAAVACLLRVGPSRLLAEVRPMVPLIALLFLLQAFFAEGKPVEVPLLRGLGVSLQGIRLGLFVGWQFACLLTTASFLTMTTAPSEIVAAIERILHPLRRLGVPSRDLAMGASVALRFLPVYLEELDRIRTARAARGGGGPRQGIGARFRAARMTAVQVLLGTFRRAGELADAIEARGYAGQPATTLRELRIAGPDRIALVCLALFAAGLTAGRIWG
ncbi:MAG TPA: energy-coupling factor transporter transmembrane component T [Syntrophales bacterium]|nr:energy-coupling factor transporter transmembrane component T [Syntrophales bacterium]